MSLRKQLKIKKMGIGSYEGRPYWGHKANIYHASTGAWNLSITEHVDFPDNSGWSWNPVYQHSYRTMNQALIAINEYGKNEVETINILNPEAGKFMISLHQKGGCCDPGTERYHCM